MANTVTRLLSNGTFQASGMFDEVSLNSGSIYLSGSSAYLTVPRTSNPLTLGSNNFTFDFWFYYPSGAAAGVAVGVSNITGGGPNCSYIIYYNGSGGMTYYLSSSGASYDIASGVSMGSVVPNTWNHVALVRNGSTFTPYINGLSGTPTSNSSAINTGTNPIGIGAGGGGGGGPLTGYLSNIRIVNGTALYTANFIPQTAASANVANTVLLLTNSPQNPYGDSSSLNSSVVLHGTPQFNTLGPFYFPANTSINLANTNNTPNIGSNTNIVSSTTSNGVVMTSGGFDEVTYNPSSGYLKNLLQQTILLTNNYWTIANATVAITSNTTAPDGTNTAWFLQEDSTLANGHRVQGSVGPGFTTYSVLVGNQYTLSAYAKATTNRPYLFLLMGSGPGYGQQNATYNLLTGAVSGISTSNGTTANMYYVGNGWWRCILTTPAVSVANSVASVWLSLINQAGTLVNYTGDGTDGTYIWGPQLEVGNTATIYEATRSNGVPSTSSIQKIDPTGTIYIQGYFDEVSGIH